MKPDRGGASVVTLAAVEAAESCGHVVDAAARQARDGGATELHLIHVIGAGASTVAPLGGPAPSFTELVDAARELLDELMMRASVVYTGRVVGHVAIGEPWREILQMAANLRADLVVVGTADRTGLSRMFLGSVAARVVRKAQCPVLVARRKDYHSRVVPDIEPPCPDCLAVQRETARETLWCARHAETHAHARLHYETPPSFGRGAMLVRPEP
jgi:nucleotide-binding universal stress UspA family protein